MLSRSAASLRFFGDDLDPEEVTSLLGAPPTVGARKGGVWHTSRGVEKVARTGSWRLQGPRREPGDLDAQVTALLAPLTVDLGVWKALAERFKGDIFCGLFLEETNEGLSLTPETLAAIGNRGLTLDLDIYGPLGED